MPDKVTILSRQPTTRLLEGAPPMAVVDVHFATDTRPPRVLSLPLELYRTPTEEERVKNARYFVVPKDAAAVAEERLQIVRDLAQRGREEHDTFELEQ